MRKLRKNALGGAGTTIADQRKRFPDITFHLLRLPCSHMGIITKSVEVREVLLKLDQCWSRFLGCAIARMQQAPVPRRSLSIQTSLNNTTKQFRQIGGRFGSKWGVLREK